MWTSLFSHRRVLLFSTSLSSSSRTSSRSHLLSSCNYSSHAPLSRVSRRQQDDVRVSVWWNVDTCNLPNDFPVFKLPHTIIAALRANGLKGPIQTMNAYGDTNLLYHKSRDKTSCAIKTWYNPTGEGEIVNEGDKVLVWDVLTWAADNPPPAHLFFVCAGSYYANLLHELRMQKYNILLASNDAPVELSSAATITWDWDTLTNTKLAWNSLISGENFIGKHLNYPPDSPDGSSGLWYGNFDLPIEDPFSTSTLDSKLPPAHISILDQVRHILKSHPEGILLDHLRTELVKVDWKFDSNYYHKKKFSEYLASCENFFQLQYRSDGHTLVKLDTLLAGGENKAEESISHPKQV